MADPIRSWNHFIGALQEAKGLWLDHKEEMMNQGRIDTLPVVAQRLLRYTNIQKASSFEKAMSELIPFWVRSGGLDEMLIKVPKEEKETEDVEV